MSSSGSKSASRWTVAAGSIALGCTALLVAWRRLFRAKPARAVTQHELDATRSLSITLHDGRVLQYYEFGARDGRATLFVHGMVATGRRFEWWHHEFIRYGIRAICPTLPGWGLSDPVPDRQLADYPHDIKQLLAHLRVIEFDVIGVSFGGMHAAAIAAKLNGAPVLTAAGGSSSASDSKDGACYRVMRCGLMGAHCPHDIGDGFDITHGMNDAFRVTSRMLRVAPFLVDPLAYAMRKMFQFTDTRRASARVTFTSPDYRYIVDWPEHKKYDMTNFFGDIMAESMARSHFGYSDCGRLAILQPWGFSPRDIKCPTLIVAANEDNSTPPEMQRHLARLIPNNRLVSYSGGHLIFNVLFPLMLAEWDTFALDGMIGAAPSVSPAFASAARTASAAASSAAVASPLASRSIARRKSSSTALVAPGGKGLQATIGITIRPQLPPSPPQLPAVSRATLSVVD